MKSTIGFLLLLSFPTLLLAQEKDDRTQDHQKGREYRVERMKSELQLSDEQSGKIKTILENHEKNTAAERASLKDKRQKTEADLRAVLNDQQRQKFDSMKQQRQQKMNERRSNRNCRPR